MCIVEYMPRRFVAFRNHEHYHAYNRGVNKLPVAIIEEDFMRLLELIEFYSYKPLPIRYSYYRRLSLIQKELVLNRLKEHGRRVSILAYCFMPNHIHLLIRQEAEGGLSRFMSDLLNGYTRYVNTRHGRIGPLFQGQFKAKHIENDSQLLHLSRYIHLNPYSAGIAELFDGLIRYTWNSLPEYVNPARGGLCDTKLILGLAGGRPQYRKFVEDHADYQRQLEIVKDLIIEKGE